MASIIDSYSESNKSTQRSVRSGGQLALAQAFTGNGASIGSSVFYMDKVGSPTDTIISRIYASTGTMNTSAAPTGSALATSDALNISTIPATFTLITFTYSGANQITLTNGTNYCVSVEHTGGDSSNYANVSYDHASSTHPGNYSGTFDLSTWSPVATDDLCFYVYDNGGGSIASNLFFQGARP